MGDMAISNSIGSNVFDILVGLGLPWALQTLCIDYGSIVSTSPALPQDILLDLDQNRTELCSWRTRTIVCNIQCRRLVLCTYTTKLYLRGHRTVYHLNLRRSDVLISLLHTRNDIWNRGSKSQSLAVWVQEVIQCVLGQSNSICLLLSWYWRLKNRTF